MSKKEIVLNQKLATAIFTSGHGFPDEFTDKVQKLKFAFIHKYPNLDQVLKGGDLIGRPTFVQNLILDGEIIGMILEASDTDLPKFKKLLKKDNRIFIGVPQTKGVSAGYLEGIENNLLYISGMGSEILK